MSVKRLANGHEIRVAQSHRSGRERRNVEKESKSWGRRFCRLVADEQRANRVEWREMSFDCVYDAVGMNRWGGHSWTKRAKDLVVGTLTSSYMA